MSGPGGPSARESVEEGSNTAHVVYCKLLKQGGQSAELLPKVSSVMLALARLLAPLVSGLLGALAPSVADGPRTLHQAMLRARG